MTDIAIRVENLSKLYRIGVKQERYKTLRDTLVSSFKNSIKSLIPNKPDQRDRPDRPDKLKKPDRRAGKVAISTNDPCAFL